MRFLAQYEQIAEATKDASFTKSIVSKLGCRKQERKFTYSAASLHQEVNDEDIYSAFEPPMTIVRSTPRKHYLKRITGANVDRGVRGISIHTSSRREVDGLGGGVAS
ncbi:hypothetical protein J6590_000759 [Homalodisca vitripennis]|nr:hypothetical protein J6590_090137 [Homalodisca vitripennis]KAG8324413.1 hypothetical protein J6590_092871 [Homalodisca vitripennis]KAG8328102.1 hypothetical protein J6590_000759 [Homalodisca vitripennis]